MKTPITPEQIASMCGEHAAKTIAERTDDFVNVAMNPDRLPILAAASAVRNAYTQGVLDGIAIATDQIKKSMPPRIPAPDEDGDCTICGLPFEDPAEEAHTCPPGFTL